MAPHSISKPPAIPWSVRIVVSSLAAAVYTGLNAGVVRRPELQMGFCVDCHRAEGASHDCWMCHR